MIGFFQMIYCLLMIYCEKQEILNFVLHLCLFVEYISVRPNIYEEEESNGGY